MSDSPSSPESSIPILSDKKILVTGAAGFIGFHLSNCLLAGGNRVVGLDNFNPYYEVSLKRARSALLAKHAGFELAECSLEDSTALRSVWKDFAPDIVIHLAAQAGVRYSIDNPDSYINANIIGTYNLLQTYREYGAGHLLAASTSSVYGSNPSIPFKEGDPITQPLSLYAATKGATELLGHTYSSLFLLPMTFFRFFTAYGPWGRPDMAAFKFTRAILAGEPIDIYNHGNLSRDFTYIDDLVEAIVRLTVKIPGHETVSGNTASPMTPYRAINIGKGSPDRLMDFIVEIEKTLGIEAKKNFLDMQPGEMLTTYADTSQLESLIGYRPTTPLSVGIPEFVSWFRNYYKV